MGRAPLAALVAATSLQAGAAVDVLPLWDFSNPEVSEARFREAARGATPDDAAILQTQVARTYGLRRQFDRARAILRELDPNLASLGPEANARYHLEWGRSLASAAHRPADLTAEARSAARDAFVKAFDIAKANRLDDLAIDSLHMIPFAETHEQVKLARNEEALRLALASDQAGGRRWEASLRNNIGHSLHGMGRFDEALAMFRAAAELAEKGGNARRIHIAHWMVAWTLRSLGRVDEALAIQLRLERGAAAAGAPDEYVFEELARLYEIKGEATRAAHYKALHAKALAQEQK